MSDHEPPKLGTIPLDGYTLNLDYFLTKEYGDIGEASSELPPLIEWVNTQLQSLVEQRLIKKQEIKEIEAAVFFDLRNGLFEERYAGKQTSEAVAHAIALDGNVKRIHREYAQLDGWVKRLTNLQFSLQSKLDLVRSVEATRRKLTDPEKTNEIENEHE